jgi:tetratricopeptide (TPR) repeat protein
MSKFDAHHHFAELVLPMLAGAALLLAGRALLHREETIASLESKVRLEPDNAAYHEHLANLLAEAGRQDEAIEHFRTVLQFNPTNITAPCGLALALGARGDNLEAQRTLEKSLKLHPEDAATNEALADLVIKSLGDLAYPVVQKYYETALRSDPTRANAALGLAKIYLAQNRVLDAGRVLVKPAAAHDRNAALHLQLAGILALLGRYDQASLEFDAGTARDPDNSDAYCTWGVMLIAAGKPEKADLVLRRALELKPDSALYHMHLARALRNEGLLIDARKEFQTALDKDIRCIPVYLELASTYQSMHEEKVAEDYLRLGMQADPDSIDVKIALARLLTMADDPLRRNFWEAATLLQTCVGQTHGQDVNVLVMAAEGWERVEMHDRALELIENALAWGKLHDLTPELMERLLSYRQRYVIALAPPVEGNPSTFNVEGLRARDPADEPWPDPLQPRVETLIDKPLNLSKPPAPGSALDPALYIKDAVRKTTQGFLR